MSKNLPQKLDTDQMNELYSFGSSGKAAYLRLLLIEEQNRVLQEILDKIESMLSDNRTRLL